MPISREEFDKGKVDIVKELLRRWKHSLPMRERKYIFRLAVNVSVYGYVDEDFDIDDWISKFNRDRELDNTLISDLLYKIN